MYTAGLSQFGYRELDMAGDLLKQVSNGSSGFQSLEDFESFRLGDGLTLQFNSNSGYVYFCDDDYNVWMINDNGKLESWHNCTNCGNEGFRSDKELAFNFDENECGKCSKR